jgi:hypothetical protein
VHAGENLLSIDVKNLENAEKVVKEFLWIFKNKLNEAIKLYKEGKENYTQPVLELFRDNTLFKWTVFGKIWAWKDYADTYFKEFVKKIPKEVSLDEIEDFAFTEDGLVVKWKYTFDTEEKGKIKGSFLMLIGKDNKWYHFKVFHSAAEDDVQAL